MVWVLPGDEEILASFLWPVSILIREDLPTFERPAKAYSGKDGFGHDFRSGLLLTNSTRRISIRNILRSHHRSFFQRIPFRCIFPAIGPCTRGPPRLRGPVLCS